MEMKTNAEQFLYESVLEQLQDAVERRATAIQEGQGWTGLAGEIESLSKAALHLAQLSELG